VGFFGLGSSLEPRAWVGMGSSLAALKELEGIQMVSMSLFVLILILRVFMF
jgi:hypothetical protein